MSKCLKHHCSLAIIPIMIVMSEQTKEDDNGNERKKPSAQRRSTACQ